MYVCEVMSMDEDVSVQCGLGCVGIGKWLIRGGDM